MDLRPTELPGTASLVDQLDKRVLIILRDGRHLVGILRSFDQFSNFVLESSCERRYVRDMFGDIPLGLYIIRGENVVMLAELDVELERSHPMLRRVSEEEILDAERAEAEASTRGAGNVWDFTFAQ